MFRISIFCGAKSISISNMGTFSLEDKCFIPFLKLSLHVMTTTRCQRQIKWMWRLLLDREIYKNYELRTHFKKNTNQKSFFLLKEKSRTTNFIQWLTMPHHIYTCTCSNQLYYIMHILYHRLITIQIEHYMSSFQDLGVLPQGYCEIKTPKSWKDDILCLIWIVTNLCNIQLYLNVLITCSFHPRCYN